MNTCINLLTILSVQKYLQLLKNDLFLFIFHTMDCSILHPET